MKFLKNQLYFPCPWFKPWVRKVFFKTKFALVFFIVILGLKSLAQTSFISRNTISNSNPSQININKQLNDSIYTNNYFTYFYNIKTKESKNRNIEYNYDNSIFLDTLTSKSNPITIIWNKYGHIYALKQLYTRQNTSQSNYNTVVTRLDLNLSPLWTIVIDSMGMVENRQSNNQFIDSSLYLSIFNSKSQNQTYLVKIEADGTISKQKKSTPRFAGPFIILNDNIYIRTFINNSTSYWNQLDRNLNSIKAIENNEALKAIGSWVNIPNTSTIKSNNLLDYLFTGNLMEPPLVLEPNLNRYYKFKSPMFNPWSNFKHINILKNKKIEIIYADVNQNLSYGFKRAIISADWKTLESNHFYALPTISKNMMNQYQIGAANNYTGGYFNDSTTLIYNMIEGGTSIGFRKELTYIKNSDYSIFPYKEEVCSIDFSVDTFYTQDAPLPVITDTTLTTSTANIFITVTPWVIDTNLPFTFSPVDKLNAHFTLTPHTYCGTKLNLISDTSLKLGESRWVLRYMDKPYTESFIIKDTINYSFKHSGWVEITHIHTLRGCTDTARDTVHYSSPGAFSISKDTLVCTPLAYKINAKNNSFHSYLWSTGSTDTMHLAIDTGIYWVRKAGSCGTYTDTVKLRWKTPLLTTQVFSLDSLVICGKNLPYNLSSNITGTLFTYTWSPTYPNLSTRPLSSFGTYKLTVTDNCHLYTDSFKLIAKIVATLPTIPDSVSLCATTYKIYRPTNLSLEEKTTVNSVHLWLNRDSLTLSKSQKLVFRWTDSCGAVTYDSIYDYQRGVFSPIPPSATLCETYVSYQVNLSTNIKQYSLVSNTWMLRDSIPLKLGLNYIKREDNCGNIQYDTVTGIEIRIVSNLLPDTVDICRQLFPRKLGVIGSYKSYRWSDGSTKDSLNITQEGSYQLTVHDGCMYQFDQVYAREVKSKAENALTEDKMEYCISQKFSKIETSLVYPLYIWNNIPSTNNFILIDTNYKLVRLGIPRICDTLKDSMVISWIDPILSPPMYTIDTSFCSQPEGAVKVTLTNGSDYSRYAWNGDTNTLSFYINSFKSNNFYARNLCYEREFTIPAYYCPMNPVGLPDAFSPNGDHLNDVWGLQGAKGIILHALSVFNRWGEKVFETQDAKKSWNGSYQGLAVPQGVYSYILDYEYIPHHVRREYRGEVLLVR